MSRPLVSLIVPNFQGKDVFPACLRSLLKQNFARLQIVFVDDSSTDGSLALAKRLFGKHKNITIIQTPENRNYVGACNYALGFCKGKYVMITNNDATFPPDWVSQMYRCVEGKRKVVGASLVITENEMSERLFLRGFKRGYAPCATIPGVSSAWRKLLPEERKSGLYQVLAAGVLIIPREALEDRIFTPEYVAYGEDIELCLRLRLKGYSIVLNKDAKMHHIGSFTRRTVPISNVRAIYHGTKNTVANILIFSEWPTLLRRLPPLVGIQLALLLAAPRDALLRLKAHWWVFSHLPGIWRRRREVQRTRTVRDRDLLQLVSYKVSDPDLMPVRFPSWIIKTGNAFMRAYCWLVYLRTFDLYDTQAEPKIDKKAVL